MNRRRPNRCPIVVGSLCVVWAASILTIRCSLGIHSSSSSSSSSTSSFQKEASKVTATLLNELYHDSSRQQSTTTTTTTTINNTTTTKTFSRITERSIARAVAEQRLRLGEEKATATATTTATSLEEEKIRQAIIRNLGNLEKLQTRTKGTRRRIRRAPAPWCCTPHVLLNNNNNNNNNNNDSTGQNCFGQTCYTSRACNASDPYPFVSLEQKEWYMHQDSANRRNRLSRFHCNKLQAAPPPAIRWCQPIETHGGAGGGGPNLTGIPIGCSAYTMGGRSGAFDRLILFPQHKLAFCGIPKGGITQWLKFLRFTLGAVDYQSVPWGKADTKPFYFDQLTRHRQEYILRDKSWTKAIFLRHPAERLLSAYLDKIRYSIHKGLVPDITFSNWVQKNLTTFLDRRCHNTHSGHLSWCTDPHWRPQYHSCAIYQLLPLFDFVGSLDHAAAHTKALLQKVALWNDFGLHFASPTARRLGDRPCASLPMDPSNTSLQLGFQQHDLPRGDYHKQDARFKMSSYYYPNHSPNHTSALLHIVKSLYMHDFQLWDALQQAVSEAHGGWVTGPALAKRLNPAECNADK